MTRKKTFWAVALFGAALMLTTATAFAQQGQGQQGQQGQWQRGGQQVDRAQRGMMGDMLYLERSWTAVSFQLDCTDEQIAKLQPIYKQALQTRVAAIQAAMQARNMEGYQQAIANCKETLELALMEVLNDDQWTELQELMAQGGGMGRGPGAPGGPGGPGGPRPGGPRPGGPGGQQPGG